MNNSKLIAGFRSFKDISGYAHALSGVLKENGECSLGGAKLLDRMIKADGAFSNRHALKNSLDQDAALTTSIQGDGLAIAPNTIENENEVMIAEGGSAYSKLAAEHCELPEIRRLTAYFDYDAKGNARAVVPGVHRDTLSPEEIERIKEDPRNKARVLAMISSEMLQKANANPELVSELLGEPEDDVSCLSLQDEIDKQHKWQAATRDLLMSSQRHLEKGKSINESHGKHSFEDLESNEDISDETKALAKAVVLERASYAFKRDQQVFLDTVDCFGGEYNWTYNDYALCQLNHLSWGNFDPDDDKEDCLNKSNDQLIYDLIKEEITPFLSKGMQNWVSSQYQNELSEALAKGELPPRPAPRYRNGTIKDNFSFKSFKFSCPGTQKFASITPKDFMCQCIKVDWPLKEISPEYFAGLQERSIAEMLKSEVVSGLITYYEEMCKKHKKAIPAKDFERAIPGYVYHKIGSTLRNQ